MIFSHWLTNTMIISRMATVSGDRIAMSTVTSVGAHLQPLDDERTRLIGGVYGKTFRIWTDSTANILEGDKLKDENGIIYVVKKGGVTTRNFGSFDYLDIIIEQTG